MCWSSMDAISPTTRGFTYGFERAQDEFLLREQFVRGDAAAPVKAEHDGACFLRKHAAFGVAADQENGNGHAAFRREVQKQG